MPVKTTPSVFVIEDDVALRDGLVLLLRSEGLRARGFASGVEFFANLPTDLVACVVTDLRMPGIDGAEVVHRLRKLHGDAWPIIVVTGYADVSSAVALMKAGVADVIEKPFEAQRLVDTLRDCLERIQKVGEAMVARAEIERRLALLTARERQVFDALADGMSNKEIGARLQISPRTVEIFRARVMAKTEAANLSTLVRMSLGLA